MAETYGVGPPSHYARSSHAQFLGSQISLGFESEF